MTMQVGIGLGLDSDAGQAAREAVRQARGNVRKEKIDLVIIFASSNISSFTILKTVNSLLGEVPVLGCSGYAIISNKGIFKQGVLIMLIGLPDATYLNTGCVKKISSKSGFKAGEELGEKMLSGFQGMRRNLSVVFSDGLITNKSNLIYGLQEKLGQSFPLIGASASDNMRFQKTEIYYNQEACEDAACGMLLGGRIDFGFGVKHGWKPLGKPRSVTKSSANILYEIDEIPAAKIYEEYLAYSPAKLKRELKRISLRYPIGIRLPGEEEYLLRNVTGINAEALIMNGDIPENSQVRLMIGTKESCLDAAGEAAEEAKTALQSKTADFVLVFDSVSRHLLLGRQNAAELEIIKNKLGNDAPIMGIYTYGEDAPLKAVNYQGRAYCHNQTIAILAVRGAQ